MSYDHDVFVSYATVDDRPAKCGWVSAFVSSLGESLAAAFGERDPNRIWWDRSNIDEEASLTEQIRTRVQKSACMVVILSQGYAKSKWCRQEREAFLAAVAGQPEADSRLFLIDLGNLEQKDRPVEFSDKRGRHFYVQPPNTVDVSDRKPLGFPTPDPTNKDHESFFAQVNQLANDLCKRVRKVRGAAAVATSIKPNSGVTVFIAEAADDVAEEREAVVRFLSDHFRVVPAIDDPLPNRWDQWQASVDAGLKDSTLFVQVLGKLPGRKIAGSDLKLVPTQCERAQAAGKRVVSWRNVAPDVVADDRMKELVATAEYWGPIAEFMNEIKRIATPVPERKPKSEPDPTGVNELPYVFINAGIEDDEQAEQLSNLLTELNCMPMRPMADGDPDEIRKDMEASLMECHGLMMVYGNIQPTWVRQQFRTLSKVQSQRKKLDPQRPLPGMAICECQPPGKPDPRVDATGLKWLDATSGFKLDELQEWLKSLNMGSAT
jgi:hypothetical protein